MGILLSILMDLLVEVVAELVLEVTGLLNEKDSPAVVAVAWFAVLGFALGAGSFLVAPHRVFQPGPIAGVSLVLAPASLAIAMEVWGRLRESSGRVTSHMVTWYGGAVMGFGLAAGRLVAKALTQGL